MNEVQGEQSIIIELSVAPEDMGKVIVVNRDELQRL